MANPKECSVKVPMGSPSTVEALRGFHVEFPRDEEVENALTRLVAQMSVRLDSAMPPGAGNRDEQDALLIVGETGTGKTRTAQRAIRLCKKVFEDGEKLQKKTIFVKFPSPFSSKELARRVLNQLNYSATTSDGSTDSELWALVVYHLQQHDIRLIHFDEFQRWKTDRSPGGRLGRQGGVFRLAETLNDLLVGNVWPIALVVTGLPEVKAFWSLEAMGQVKRRTKIVHFEQMTGAYCGAMGQALAAYIQLAGLTLDFEKTYHLESRLIFAADETVGIALEILQAAVLSAVERGGGTMTKRDFIKVYTDRHGCPLAENPFHSDQWKELVHPDHLKLRDLEAGLKAPPEPDVNGRG